MKENDTLTVNKDMSKAPKDGTYLLLWSYSIWRIGSWRVDENFPDDEPLWLDNSYDDFSCGYASIPLNPTAWAYLPKMKGE